MDDLTWLLVATKTRSEFVAMQHLERQGFQVCLPQITLRKRKHGKWQQVTEPMFPGYVFVGVVLGDQDINPICSTVGCLHVVRFGGELVPLPASVMLTLVNYAHTPPNSVRTFCAGERLRIYSGAFDGLEAVFDKPLGQDRVQVLISVFGGVRSVKVDANAIGPP